MKLMLEPDKIYHVYNHANGFENLFKTQDNFNFFLNKYKKHITPIADTFAYCLMPNHFHFALQIKPEQEILQLMQQKSLNERAKQELTVDTFAKILYFLSKQFSNLFSSYSQAFNKQQRRMGSLFKPNFSRKLVDTDDYFRQVIYYIHYNPVHHHFVKDMSEWKYSSLESFFSKKATHIKRRKVIEVFGSMENFIEYHKKDIDGNKYSDLEE